MQGIQVQSLVEELRSHVPPDQKNQNIKQKQYCIKFNKDFKKMVHILKIWKKENQGVLTDFHNLFRSGGEDLTPSYENIDKH